VRGAHYSASDTDADRRVTPSAHSAGDPLLIKIT